MRDWTKELELRLASLRLHPAREREIIDELSEHLELRYAELRDQGVGEAEALALVRSELLDEKALAEFMRPLRQANAPPHPPVPLGGTPIALERTMQDLYSVSLARTSFTLVMLVIAGGMALVLGIIGIYGVIAYVVTQRTREIGIRAALGADRRQLEGMFLRQGLTLAVAGGAIGLVAAAALGRSMSSLLFGVDALDPTAYVSALGITLAAAALASYVPARRAAAIDPIETLKVE
jgi:predicted lysophospholipase L1 biosynthesis ABC-type transport system permease subunit